MNPIMVDGTGMCGACRVIVGDEVKFACVDGPEFDGHKIDFDHGDEETDNVQDRRRQSTAQTAVRAIPITADAEIAEVTNNGRRINREFLSENRIRRLEQQILTRYVYGYNKEEAMEEASRCLHCKNAEMCTGMSGIH